VSTIQSIINQARVELEDPDGVTWKDPEMVLHALSGLNLAFQIAPHHFFGQYNTMPLATLVLTDSSPLPVQFDRAIADYIVGRAHLKDDEDARDSESAPFLALFRAQLGV
jgi:hypothetical protein